MAIIIKFQHQIEGIRKSCQLAARTLKYLETFIVPGITTGSINDLAERFIRDHGAVPAPLNYRGFPKATCISVNEVVCHGIPGERVLQEGDIVNVDVTTILNGYYGDTCRMYAVGHISAEAQQLLDVTQECLNLGIAQVAPWRRIGDIAHAISNYAEARGYSVVYQFCGHGTGMRFHEEPQINHADRKSIGPYMQPGMVFTIEPMINQGVPEAVILEDSWTAVTADRKLSAQYEHTVLVTATGCEILTLAE